MSEELTVEQLHHALDRRYTLDTPLTIADLEGVFEESGGSPTPEKQMTSREQQMARLDAFARLKGDVEKVVERYRDFNRDELTTGQFAVQILMAIMESDRSKG